MLPGLTRPTWPAVCRGRCGPCSTAPPSGTPPQADPRAQPCYHAKTETRLRKHAHPAPPRPHHRPHFTTSTRTPAPGGCCARASRLLVAVQPGRESQRHQRGTEQDYQHTQRPRGHRGSRHPGTTPRRARGHRCLPACWLRLSPTERNTTPGSFRERYRSARNPRLGRRSPAGPEAAVRMAHHRAGLPDKVRLQWRVILGGSNVRVCLVMTLVPGMWCWPRW